jgi:hypothetical protein
LVKYLIDFHKQNPTQTTLENAVISGRNDLYTYLTSRSFPNIDASRINASVYAKSKNPTFQFSKLAPIVEKGSLEWRHNHLGDVVAASGNCELLKMALKPIPFFLRDKIQILPSQLTLSYAALSGNIEMVNYLIHWPKLINLKPNDETLHCAIASQNTTLVQLLLNPSNRYYTELTEVLISNQSNSIGCLLHSHKFFLGALDISKNLMTQEQETRSVIAKQYPIKETTVESLIRSTFIMSFQNASEHCAEMFKDVLLNPTCYGLNKCTVQFLKSEFKAILDKMNMIFNENSSPYIKNIVLDSEKWLESNEIHIAEAINKLDENNKSSTRSLSQ